MNQIQEAIARVTGLDEIVRVQEGELGEVINAMEHLASDNMLLQRQIEDLDYLNLFEINQVQEVLPLRDRKKSLARLRRLRHDNPLAKQAVKLVIRFTLGRGVQWVIAPNKPTFSATPDPVQSPVDQQNSSGMIPIKFDDSTPPPKNGSKPAFAREAVNNDAPEDPLSEENDPDREIIKSFWQAPENKLAFTTHRTEQQFLDELITDGEKFYSAFEDASPPYVKVSEIPVEEIQQIVYNPDNRLQPVFYKRQYQELRFNGKNEQYEPKGNPIVKFYWDYRILEEDKADLLTDIKIPPGKIDQDAHIFHIMVNELWTKSGKRGLSELYASREWFRVFREFMEGRAAINAAAQAISYVRKVKGSPTAVAKFTGKLGSLSVGDSPDNQGSEIRKLTRPTQGAIYDSNEAVDIDWMKTDTGAQNAKEDARLLLMSAGAGVGTMVHYFGEGGDANLATAQSMELPMVKSYEDWQQIIEDFHKAWFEYVLRVAHGNDSEARDEAAEIVKRIGHIFPPIISQDVVKYTTAWAQIVRDIAPNNMAVKRQAMRAVLAIMAVPNVDGLMPEIEAEMQHAEMLRQQQTMALLQSTPGDPTASANGKPPVAGKIPNAGMSPNDKALAAGKVKVSSGPKPA